MKKYLSFSRGASFIAALLLTFALAGQQTALAQQSGTAAPSPAAAPTPVPPLSNPAVTGPLRMASPIPIDVSKMLGLSELPPWLSDLGKFDVNGAVTGIGIVQDHPTAADRTDRADVSNAQVFIQKADGPIQFYLQAGAYSLPILGTPYVTSGTALTDLFGPLPVAYLKLAPTDNFSIEAGNLPTLLGAEYTFTFENINIERGLLWNQENVINRGVQLNYSLGPVSASLSWNNGFYSNSYTWLTGALSWAINSQNSLALSGGGNVGFSKFNNAATPVVYNNSEIYDVIYSYISGPWILQPYFQWTYVPKNTKIDVEKSTSTIGGAILASYSFTDNLSLGARAEFIGTTGNNNDGSTNLLYGPGSEAYSLTLTPTYQYKQFFVRGEVSYVQAMSYTSGDTFGTNGTHPSQVRGAIETGILF